MQQIWIPRYGKPSVLQLRDAPDPTPQAGEVRIKVAASGVNFADILARMGVYRDAPPAPCVVGYEVGGVVDALGAGVPAEWEGARVMALTHFGGYSSAVCVPLVQVFRIPDEMPYEDAAALPVNALTVYQMLVAMGRVNEGDKILVHGAAGGVGWIAVQMGKLLGATVYGTASPHKHEDLYSLGIDACMDYSNYPDEVRRLTQGKGVELILDPIGGRAWKKNYALLAATGRLMMFGMAGVVSGERRNWWTLARWAAGMPLGIFNPLSLTNHNRGVCGVNLGKMWGETERMQPWAAQIIEWYQKGWLKPQIDSTYPFSQAAHAHERLNRRENVGKVLLIP